MGVLNDEQRAMNGKTLSLIVPVATRWTAHFLSLDRLLTVWKPMQITAIKHESALISSVGENAKAKLKAKSILARVRDDNWWRTMTRYVY